MPIQAISVKQVERARLDAPTLSFTSLKSLASPCLKWRHEYRLRPPKSGDARHAFRSVELKDAAQKAFPLSCHTEFNDSSVKEFNSFIQLRKQLAPPIKLSEKDVVYELSRSKALLITDWSASLFDGALSPETDGFIDGNGMPPWDTWIALVHVEGAHGIACLLSWVPQWIADKVDFAITVDAAECLSWVRVHRKRLSLHGWGKSADE